jgi:hypothetical protein
METKQEIIRLLRYKQITKFAAKNTVPWIEVSYEMQVACFREIEERVARPV